MTVNEIPGSSDAHVETTVPEHEGRRQVRIGMFVLAGMAATLFLLFLLTDPSTFRGRYKITTAVEEVLGLRNGDPVQMRGVTIGRVAGFELEREGEKVLVTLEVEGRWLIPEGSSTRLVLPSLMGPRTVEIVPGPGPGTIDPGGLLPGTAVKGILDDTESLGEMGQVVLDKISELLSPENLDAISGSLEGLDKLVGELSNIVDVFESESGGVEELMQSLRSAADGLAEATGPELRESLTNTLAGADTLVGRLNATSEHFERVIASIETILTRIQEGQGTLGRLWASDTLYTSLESTFESARLLLDDIRENPGRYFNVSVF